jgi:predicted P-loop ATPase
MKNFTTLCALLDDPIHREAIFGKDRTLRYCEMNDAILVGGIPMSNSDVGSIRLNLEAHTAAIDGKSIKFGHQEIEQAVLTIARKSPVHRVREYLEGLPPWDGTERLNILSAFLGAAGELSQQCLRKWMIGTVARPMRPGCKMDTALVLAGPQGIGKSTFFKMLAGSEWFCDSAIDVKSKDGPIVMKKSWIMEWAELESMKRARDSEQIKAFLTQSSDNYRPPYGKSAVDVPRTCVIVGTTNQEQFLADATGSRRFWVVKMTNRLDRQWLDDNRDQLFAEALCAFREGEAWWLDEVGEEKLAEVNEQFQTEDSWMEHVAWHVRLLAEVTVAEILEKVLKKEIGQWTHGDSIRVGAILTRLGWKLVRAVTTAASATPAEAPGTPT